MQQHYVFSMTTRMLAIAVVCAVLLCGVLFLLGMEIGRMAAMPPVLAPQAQPSPPAGAAPAPPAPSVAASSTRPD